MLQRDRNVLVDLFQACFQFRRLLVEFHTLLAQFGDLLVRPLLFHGGGLCRFLENRGERIGVFGRFRHHTSYCSKITEFT